MITRLIELMEDYEGERNVVLAKHNEIYVALDLALKSKKEQEG